MLIIIGALVRFQNRGDYVVECTVGEKVNSNFKDFDRKTLKCKQNWSLKSI